MSSGQKGESVSSKVGEAVEKTVGGGGSDDKSGGGGGSTGGGGQEQSAFSHLSFEDMKKQLAETQEKLMNDPRTKQLIESGQHTYDEVRKYIYEQLPKRYTVEKPSQHHAATYCWGDAGSWNPIMYQLTNVIAAPNTMFEIPPPDNVRHKVQFFPRLDAFFDHSTKQLVLFVDLPGMEKNEVEIEIDEGALTIAGNRKNPNKEIEDQGGKEGEGKKEGGTKQKERLIHDRVFGLFHRRFRLPENVKDDDITANMNNGVLTVKIQCIDLTKAKKKIDVS